MLFLFSVFFLFAFVEVTSSAAPFVFFLVFFFY